MRVGNSPVSGRVLEAAIGWQLSLGSGNSTPEQQEAFQRWYAADEEHARAWYQLGLIDQRFAAAAGPARALIAKPRQRRSLGRGLAALAVAVTAIWFAGQSQTIAYWAADERTATGETRALSLADGTRVTLDTHSAIDIRFDDQERRIVLRAGEVFIETAHDDTRPFIVQTAEGQLRALGTRFLVSQEGSSTRLGVVQSAVAARARGAASEQVIRQGQQALIYENSVEPATPLALGADAWTHGMLVVDNMRLEDLLAQLSRYRSGILQADPEVADLRITGTFPLNDTDRALQALQPALAVRLESRTRWWVMVKPGAQTQPAAGRG